MSYFGVSMALVAAFVALNVVAWAILRRYRSASSTAFLFDSDSHTKLKKVLPNDSDETLLELVRCFSSTETEFGRFRMTYAPFTEHRDTPFRSNVLNVSEGGIRLNHKSDFKDPHSNKVANIFIFGGSTALGYGVKDADTIAANLERSLGQDNVEVFNCGSQSYFSSIELISFMKFLQSGAKIDQAIFIDGLNDVFHNCPVFRNRSRYSEHIARYWDSVDYLYGYASVGGPSIYGNFLKGALGRLPLAKLARKVAARVAVELGGSTANTRLSEPWAVGSDIDSLDYRALATRIAELTVTNWRAIRAIGASFGVKTSFCLQPLYYVGMAPGMHFFQIRNEHSFWPNVYDEYCRVVRDRSSGTEGFIDLSRLFESVTECPFVDSHHYSPYGNRLVAEALGNFYCGSGYSRPPKAGASA
jgi:hypothetical protein